MYMCALFQCYSYVVTTLARASFSCSQFGFTLFSLTLNELDKTVTCPTDSRFRPDQRYLEDNDVSVCVCVCVCVCLCVCVCMQNPLISTDIRR